MSRNSKMLTDIQDAYGHLLSDYHNGQENVEVVEREDGFIDVSRLGPFNYFAEYEDWAEHQRLAIAHATGRVLDIGCGVGRHCLYLQEHGHDVLGTDISPLAIQTCQSRGLKNAVVAPITQLSSKIGTFDTILMMGHNFGLVGSYKRAKWLLKTLRCHDNRYRKNYRRNNGPLSKQQNRGTSLIINLIEIGKTNERATATANPLPTICYTMVRLPVCFKDGDRRYP